MWVIRKEQEAAFVEVAIRRFESFMLAYLSDFYPQRLSELGEAGARRFVRLGIERAEVYGITRKCDVCRYIDVMVNLGPDFDRDPALPWAAELLSDPVLTPPGKAAALFERVP